MTLPAMDILFLLLILPALAALGQECPNEEPVFYEDSYATIDYALLGDEKQLSLCRVADHFTGCDIRWFKDGATLMPSSNVMFVDNSQYVFINDVTASDAGNYSCSVTSRGGEKISRNLTLRLYEDTLYPPLTNSWSECKFDDAPVGGNASAVCKFDVGVRLDEVVCTWWKKNASAVLGSEEEWLPIFVFPEIQYNFDGSCEDPSNDELRCGLTDYPPNTIHVFTCLTLYNITEEYCGKYVIEVSNGDVANFSLQLNLLVTEPPKPTIESTTVLIVVFSILGACLILILVWQSVKTDVKLHVKDNFGNKTENDGKLYDAYISYVWNNTDTQFALSLKKHLELRGYKVFVPEVEITPGGCTVEEIAKALEKSRRFIMILSEKYINGSFSAYEVSSFIDQVSQYRKNIISVTFKGSSVDTENCRTILKHVLSVSRVVKWNTIMPGESDMNGDLVIDRQDSTANVMPTESAVRTIEKSFKTKVFKELLLGMPPKPKGDSESVMMQGQSNSGFSNNI